MPNTLTKEEEKKLLFDIWNGENKAFVQLVNLFKNRLFNFFYHCLNRYTLAEDLTQRTFLQIHEDPRMGDEFTGLREWIFSIAVDLTLSQPEPDSGMKARYAAPKDREKNLSGESEGINFSRIDMAYKLPLILHEVEQMTYEEISRTMNKPINRVKSLVHKGRLQAAEFFRDGNKPDPVHMCATIGNT